MRFSVKPGVTVLLNITSLQRTQLEVPKYIFSIVLIHCKPPKEDSLLQRTTLMELSQMSFIRRFHYTSMTLTLLAIRAHRFV